MRIAIINRLLDIFLCFSEVANVSVRCSMSYPVYIFPRLGLDSACVDSLSLTTSLGTYKRQDEHHKARSQAQTPRVGKSNQISYDNLIISASEMM